MALLQKLTPPEILFSVFTGWVHKERLGMSVEVNPICFQISLMWVQTTLNQRHNVYKAVDESSQELTSPSGYTI